MYMWYTGSAHMVAPFLPDFPTPLLERPGHSRKVCPNRPQMKHPPLGPALLLDFILPLPAPLEDLPFGPLLMPFLPPRG